MTMYATGSPATMAGHDDRYRDEWNYDSGSWIMPVSPAATRVAPVSPPPPSAVHINTTSTAAWAKYVQEHGEKETADRVYATARRRARRDAGVRTLARVICTLLSIAFLTAGSMLLINGVERPLLPVEFIGGSGLLVLGGGTLVALVYALTEN